MNLRYAGILYAFMFLVVMISGCTSDTPYQAPAKVETAPVQNVVNTPAPTLNVDSTQQTIKQEIPKIRTFKIGDTATDDQLKVTLNSIRYAQKIDEQNNEFLVAVAPEGKTYAIVDITIENMLADKTQSISSILETEIVDAEGYSYGLDFAGYTALSQQFKDGDILPGMKRRGKWAYLVPSNAAGQKFIFKFDAFTGTAAVFIL